MKIGILGTGGVGANLGTHLTKAGHQVMMGSRTAENPKAAAWRDSAGANASAGTFADAAAFGDVLFNCVAGQASIAALEAAGRDNMGGKVLLDLSNPLDFSRGMPPTLTICNTNSVGEEIQQAFPDVRVVKTLNTVTAALMTNPGLIPGDHVIFVSGNDEDAKAQVVGWLGEWFGWPAQNIMDLGDITTARGTEMYLPLWIRMMVRVGSPLFSINVVRATQA